MGPDFLTQPPEIFASSQGNGDTATASDKLYADSDSVQTTGRRPAPPPIDPTHLDIPQLDLDAKANAEQPAPATAAPPIQAPQLRDLPQRLARGGYGGVGMAWTNVTGQTGDPTTDMAKHGLAFVDLQTLHLNFKDDQIPQLSGVAPDGKNTDDIDRTLAMRKELLQKNPNMVILAEVREYDANPNSTANHTAIPKESPWWQHDSDGNQLINQQYKQFDLLDLNNPQFQDHVAAQARALVQSGAVDGVMMDWWKNDAAHLALLKKVRAAIGPHALIMVNANENQMPKEMTGLVNGYYMESAQSKDLPDLNNAAPGADLKALEAKTDAYWQRLQDSLDYQAKYAASPQVPFLETWWDKDDPAQRGELDRMRATTTLAMTHSDGYSLFADPDNNGETPDHSHSWYPFYDAAAHLGKPAAKGTVRPDGSTTREFENGTVVCNAVGDKATTVTFQQPRIQASSLKDANLNDAVPIPAGTPISVPAHDGDIFLFVPDKKSDV